MYPGRCWSNFLMKSKLIRLEQYYSGGDVWDDFSNLFAKYGDFQDVHDLAGNLND